MKMLYFDCFSGISGDMTIGALLDAGGDFTHLKKELEKLHITEEYRLMMQKVVKNGITSTKFDVVLKHDEDHHHEHSHTEEQEKVEQHDYAHIHGYSHEHVDTKHSYSHDHTHGDGDHHGHSHSHTHGDGEHHGHSHSHDHGDGEHHGHSHSHTHGDGEHHGHTHSHHHGHGHHHHHHRAYKDIVKLITESDLSEKVKRISLKIFKKIGEAEGKIHGMPLEDVHFHEVGAVDSIIDIVGTAILIEQLGIEEIKSAQVPTGSGKIHIDHGVYPVPAPATLEILRGVPIERSELKAELTTPTGAGILAVLANEFCPFPSMQVKKIGYGAGTKTFPDHPNVLRVVIGELL